MSAFKINLAKEYTMSGKKRARFYWLMILYFLFCGALLIDTARQAMHTINNISSSKKNLATMRERFSKKYPDASDVTSYTKRLEKELSSQQHLINQLLDNSSEAVPLAECLYRFGNGLPQDIHLSKLEITPSEEGPATVHLSFTMTQDAVKRVDPSVLVKQWKDDSDLKQLLSNITLADRQDNINMNNKFVTVFSCTASLQKGKS